MAMKAYVIRSKNSQEQEDLFNRKEIKSINFDIVAKIIQIYFFSRRTHSLEVATELIVYSKIFLFNAISRFLLEIQNQIRFLN